MDWRFEMSEIEMVAAGRWVKPENVIRYLRAVAVGKGAVARWRAAREAEREAGPETGPVDLSSEV